MPDVIVFNYGRPRHKLLAWLLADGGLAVEEVRDLDEALRAVREHHAPAMLLNSTEPEENLAPICHQLAAADHIRILYPQTDDELARPQQVVDCDVRVRYADDAADFVRQVREAIAEG